ncbi:MAG: cardiolipin synthase, partial [Rubricoccaceae bacterium]|nr:cardiolipin synthase [Rubricoccaceae bacterium]
MFDGTTLGWVLGIGIPLIHLIGFGHAVDAIMKTRTPQGATGWAISLIAFPYLALPLYWVFGRVQFDEYCDALRTFDAAVNQHLTNIHHGVLTDFLAHPDDERGELRAFRALSTLPFTRGNDAELHVDGDATFEAIFNAIEGAEDYILAQFYIIHDDNIGRRFKEQLIRKVKEGVRVFLLYDEIGSAKLPRRYKSELQDAGVRVSGFAGKRRWLGRFRINFRNHRKIVIVDGKKALIGGLNVGDEYLGHDPKLTPWRDTHMSVVGPMVQGIQISFLRDWYYGREEILDVRWKPQPSDRDRIGLVLASGPADELETCGLLFMHAIDSAEERVWLATPYFVPDGRVLGALQLAALRGVDVRILMPRMTDSVYFKFVPYAYLPEVERAGVKIYLYEEGFMHQKVCLVDNDYATVGTANMDNRSFRLNFELTCLFNDADF